MCFKKFCHVEINTFVYTIKSVIKFKFYTVCMYTTRRLHPMLSNVRQPPVTVMIFNNILISLRKRYRNLTLVKTRNTSFHEKKYILCHIYLFKKKWGISTMYLIVNGSYNYAIVEEEDMLQAVYRNVLHIMIQSNWHSEFYPDRD